MPNVAKLLREEIVRLARREAKAAIGKLKSDNARLKRVAADHKRRIAKLESDSRNVMPYVEAQRQESLKVAPDEVERARLSGKMVKSIRGKLRLSQVEFAKLVGVSAMAVVRWEQRKGRLTLRGNSKAQIVGLRKLTAAEARQRLAEMPAKMRKVRKTRKVSRRRRR